ncbi:MBOAT family O-acyltransferase [Paenibacillus sp. GCM10027626]|uniref:MBOAT family O-acyltransferase n=1 Tax=Paenibacillus sp. GCM10027626 TaxID=3273411 RepID=UPI003644CF4F
MFYTDWSYWLFIAVVSASCFAAPIKLRPFLIIIAGCLFYWYYAGPFLLVLLSEAVLIGWAMAQFGKTGRRWVYIVALSGAIAVLIYCKYRGLLLQPLFDLLPTAAKVHFPQADDLILPLGVSYFTFELIHYVVEKRRGTLPDHRFGDFLAFVLFFPTLFAGPIKSFQLFQPQLAARYELRLQLQGIGLIVKGLFKKLVIAGTLELLAEPLYSPEGFSASSPALLWTALLSYTFVIYFDFSGYSDIAIGTARLLGIVLPPNFRNPYFSRNIAEFWNRWHISLGNWLTRYIYYPLGGSRCSEFRTCLNLLATMAVSGLWHGAAWHFVVWGIVHGMMLCIYRIYAKQIKTRWYVPIPHSLATVLSVGFTFLCVTLSRLFFVLPLQEGWSLASRLFQF